MDRPHSSKANTQATMFGVKKVFSTVANAASTAVSSPAAQSIVSKATSIPAKYPFAFGVIFSGCKTSFSDLLVQKVVERREHVDWRRNGAFAMFGFFYLGGVQYTLYVPIFSRLFPNAASFALKPLAQKFKDTKGIIAVLAQTFIDQCVHHPLLYFPVFYCTKELVVSNGQPDFRRCLQEYRHNMSEDLQALWKIWVPATMINFAFSESALFVTELLVRWLLACVLDYGSVDYVVPLLKTLSLTHTHTHTRLTTYLSHTNHAYDLPHTHTKYTIRRVSSKCTTYNNTHVHYQYDTPVPMHLRIPFVAGVSLLWTGILSTMRGGDVAHADELLGGAVTGASLHVMEEALHEAGGLFTQPVNLDASKSHIVLTASGRDKPGWVALLSRAVCDAGGSVTESKMVRLGDEFIVMMHVAVDPSESQNLVKYVQKQKTLKDLTVHANTISRRKTGTYQVAMTGVRLRCVAADK